MDAPHPTQRGRLALLFFCTAMPMGIWSVPLANVFAAHGKGHLVPWVLSTTAVAAFISPLFVGALADQRMAPTRLFRWLACLTSFTLLLTCLSLRWRLEDSLVLLCAQVQALVATPVWSIASSIVFSRLQDAKREFGPLRACATFGWMAGCWLLSFVLHSDASLRGGFAASGLWLLAALVSRMLPDVAPTDAPAHRSWLQILGLDALELLRNRDHRVVFATAALYCMPLAAFYPYTALQLKDLGVKNISAVMSLAQTTEILVMLLLSRVMTRYRLKWIFLTGIALCVVRYSLNAVNGLGWIVTGTVMHGLAFTLYFITTQIYLEERIDPRWRVRAQALLALLMSGVGNLCGYLGGGWWHDACLTAAGTDWRKFWLGETALTAAVCLFFALAYRGRQARA
ncbi:MAG: putative nucleoside transporter YegT [Prosthecobacter sp.]|nr:putative nucleoside transporter YegT [Prosthecobacter sp.]